MPNAVEKKKILTKTHLKTPYGIKSCSIPKREVRDYLVSVSKTNLLVGAAKTETKKVLGSPLTVTTRRVKQITSKATVSEKVPVLAKSRSKEGAKTRSQTLLNTSMRERNKWPSLVRVFHKDPFIGKP